MKQLLVLSGCVVVLLGLVGCQNAGRGVEKIVDSNEQFPEFLVGVWKADEYNWTFKFEPDGTILRLEHMLAGKVRMEEGGSQLEGREEGSYAVFIMGPYNVNYTASTRELSVRIVLDYFRMEMPIGVLEGASDDYFKGLVSEDGKTWKADWIGYTELEGADRPDLNLIEANPVPLVFTKIDIK